MVVRIYDEDKVGFIEYSEDKEVLRVKKFYGEPRFYSITVKDKETGDLEKIRLENAIQSWRSY